MNQAIVEAITQIVREKEIDRDAFQEIIESVFRKAIEKRYGTSDNFDVIFNMDKGDIEILAMKVVVPDGELEDEATEIEYSNALKIDPDIEIGEEFAEVIDYNTFGRRLVISAKQNLVQKIKEIEKKNLVEEYSKRVGEVVIGDVHQITPNGLRINIDKTEVIMPASEKIYNERYRRGQSIKAIISDVRETTRDPEIIVSRRDPRFVQRLFELEVPEIYDNIVEIKIIAREPGDRTKIAVESNDRRVDPVGACVGIKGVRIQAIVRELNNEKIDIIHWTTDREMLIRRALAPVIPLEIIVQPDNDEATVVIPDDQMSIAIGRRGQNIRLASQICGIRIEPVRESEYYSEELSLDEIEEFDENTLIKLKEAGYTTADEVLDGGLKNLLQIPDMTEEDGQRVLDIVNAYFE